jgi:hypothetical protein
VLVLIRTARREIRPRNRNLHADFELVQCSTAACFGTEVDDKADEAVDAVGYVE